MPNVVFHNAPSEKKLTDEEIRQMMEDVRNLSLCEKNNIFNSDEINPDHPYYSLFKIFEDVYERVARSKGKERHVQNSEERFENQQICEIPRRLNTYSGLLYQAIKKMYEIDKINFLQDKKNELLDAIAYIAATIILIDEQNGN